MRPRRLPPDSELPATCPGTIITALVHGQRLPLGAIVIAALTISFAVACGGGSGDPGAGESEGYEAVFAALEGLEGAPRLARLQELVEAEGGRLDLYTSMSPSVVGPVVEAFEDRFGIDVAQYRANSSAVLQRLLEEALAGFRGADVVESSGPEMIRLAAEQILLPYETPALDDLIEGTRYEGWTADRLNTFVVSWNTELVAAGDRPTAWEGLADPRWRGKIAIELEDVAWYKTLWEHWVDQGLTPEQADARFEEILRNAVVVKGHTVMGELMAAGEFDAGVNYLHIVQNIAADGAPLAFEPAVEPIIARPNGVGLVAAAKHPAAATLFAEWLLTEGQEVVAEANVDPVRRDLAVAPTVERLFVDLESLTESEEEWTERFERLLGLAGSRDDG
jgi:iron(III) transport system substrate-binding protein